MLNTSSELNVRQVIFPNTKRIKNSRFLKIFKMNALIYSNVENYNNFRFTMNKDYYFTTKTFRFPQLQQSKFYTRT